MPPTDDGEIDTSTLDAARLRELLPAGGAELAERGQLFLELVVEDADAPAELEAILEVCSSFAAADMARYAMLPRPIPFFSQGEYRGGEEFAMLGFRGLPVVELAFEDRDPRNPLLIGRPARIFDNESLLVFCWRSIWSYPEFPGRRNEDAYMPAREFPGVIVPSPLIAEAIERGVPELQARFATEFGGLGPRHLDTAVKTFDADPAMSVQSIGENWLASVMKTLGTASGEGLEAAHAQWELDLQGDLAAEENGPGGPVIARLTRFGAIASLLEEAREDAAEPSDHAEPFWFSRSSASEDIESALVETENALSQFGETLRSSIALASAVSSAAALRLQQRTQLQSEGLQAAVRTISSLVLGPALVFGIYGANVPVPFGGTWIGFVVMLVLAVASAVAIWFGLERVAAKHSIGPTR